MKKNLVALLCAMVMLAGCAAPVSEPPGTGTAGGSTPSIDIVFDGDVAPILAAEDDYIKAFSAFDYAGKFKAKAPLNYSQRLQMYSDAIEPYTDKEKQRIQNAYATVLQGLSGIHAEMPKEILVFSDGVTESGEAYTRANAVCVPKKYMRFLSDKKLTRFIAHETFHILSRYNPQDRDAWYGILGYQKVNAMNWPPEIASLTIANPDAPHNTYVIRCNYNGKPYAFMPVLYAKAPYDLSSNKSFFKYVKEGMLAVEVVDSTPKPVYQDGKPLIVEKKDLDGFTEQVGKNTKYTIHAEETTADHFAMLIMGGYEKAPNPEMIEALKKLLY